MSRRGDAQEGTDGSDRRRHSRGAGAARCGWLSPLLFAGPAVIASIAYMDPGNFATKIQAGAKYGYSLLWVVLERQCRRHAVSGAVGQARHRDRAQFGRNVPGAFSPARRLGAVGRQRSGGDGDRPRRIPRRRHRPFAVVPYTAARRDGRHGRPDLRHPDVRRAGVSPDRTDHRRARRRHRPLLSRRNVHRAGRLGRGGVRQRGSAIAGRRRGDDCRRHRRRDDHAARDLPAFRPHPEPGAGAQRRRKAPVAAVLEHRGPHRSGGRRSRQYGDGGDGRERVSRGPQRRRRNRDRLFDADAAARAGRGGRVPDGAAGVRACRVRRSARWPVR